MKAADPREQLKVEELREGVADEERRPAELGEETRRAQSRLAALRSDLASATGPSVAQANHVAMRRPAPPDIRDTVDRVHGIYDNAARCRAICLRLRRIVASAAGPMR